MADITEVKRLLAGRALEVAQHLLPNGRKEGQEWRAGSVQGESGKSLGVHLAGAKAGLWSDFAGEKGGDLIDLWSRRRGLALTAALDEARAWLGLAAPVFTRPAPKSYSRPPKPQCHVPQAVVRDYLREDRNLSGEAIAAYKIGERNDRIVFPFLLPDGSLVLVKERQAVEGASPVPTAANCEPVAFGWQAIPLDARAVTIVEGEIDAPSMFDYGYPALSVPFGGGGGDKQQWIENDYERLLRFERIYIATDADEQGDRAAEEIANRLGRHRCLRVRLPRKDANACLTDGVPKAEIDAAIAGAEHLDPDGLHRASDYSDSVVTLFWPREGDHVGYRTPFDKLGDKLLFRPAELTVWQGASGAGKSQILSHCVVDFVRQGGRACLSSLEMKPAQTLKRMCKQAVGVDRVAEPAIRAALQWLDQGLLLYELTGKKKADELLEIFSYARAKYGCDQFIIDSLMRLGVAGDDYNTQEAVVYRLVDWAIANNVHVHLVAHSRKGDRDQGVPGTEDVKGAMEIGANAFNVISVWRNRSLEDQIKAAETDERRAELLLKPGVILNVCKQRNGDFEGKVALWFDQGTYRYHSAGDRSLWGKQYLPSDWRTAA